MKKRANIFIMVVVTVILSACAANDKMVNIEDSLTATEEEQTNLIKTNSYNQRDEISVDEIIFKNFNVIYTGKFLLEYAPKNEIIYFNEQVSFLGELMDDTAYVFITITLENTSDKMSVIYLGCGDFVTVDENGQTIDGAHEVRYRSDYTSDDPTRKDYYKCELEPKSVHTYTVGYILPVSMLESDNLYYKINRYGEWFSPTNFRYIKVNL
ncbi:MAG: hypothetical protein FWE25_07550 [Lachnospiraceae bacterium]|nr:hypothetical protein [Lachnospiraceae bacterium]